MSNKNLSYFMREPAEEIVKVPAPDTFRDEAGNRLELEVKILDQATITKINNNYRTRSVATDKKGNPLVINGEVVWKTEKDSAKTTNHILAEALVYPDLKSHELMDFYKCHDITEMPLKVFPTSKEYNHVIEVVFGAIGLGSFGVEDEEGKSELEKEVDDAKN